jgi:hypothetical protein
MEGTSVRPNPCGPSRSGGKIGRTRKYFANESPVPDPRSTRVSPARGPDAREDWMSAATADPAFWLKGVKL